MCLCTQQTINNEPVRECTRRERGRARTKGSPLLAFIHEFCKIRWDAGSSGSDDTLGLKCRMFSDESDGKRNSFVQPSSASIFEVMFRRKNRDFRRKITFWSKPSNPSSTTSCLIENYLGLLFLFYFKNRRVCMEIEPIFNLHSVPACLRWPCKTK